MTDTHEQLQAELDGHPPTRGRPEQHSDTQALETLTADIRMEIDAICKVLAEHHIGGSRHPTQLAFHRRDKIAERGLEQIGHLKNQLTTWSAHGRVTVLLILWAQTYDVLQVTLAYNTLRVVRRAVHEFVDEQPTSVAQTELEAMRVVCDAMDLIVNDGWLFQLINMSDANGLKTAAREAATRADEIADEVSALAPEAAAALADIRDTAQQLRVFYGAGALAADAVVEFEDWLTTAPMMDSADPASDVRSGAPAIAAQAAIDEIDRIKPDLAPTIREICEPWERVLVAIRDVVNSDGPTVFVPNRVSVRYCYPFAVDVDDASLPWSDEEKKPAFLEGLRNALSRINVTVGQNEELGSSQFFYREAGHYGGLKVHFLEGITVNNLPLPVLGADGRSVHRGSPLTCDVWLELSDMGNHCLCIQPPALIEPRPHELYRAMRGGTPFVIGESVVVNHPFVGPIGPSPADERPVIPPDVPNAAAWDSLHAFSRDVVVAVAEGLLGCLEDTAKFKAKFKAHFEPGNMQEIVVAQTKPPSETQPKQIATALDGAVGGKILLRSTHQAASTLAEWVRYPPVSERELALIEDTPVLGMAGDWFANTGEMTVFGFVAAPAWHTDVYTEAGQFASSWSPLLRLWGRRLQGTIQASQPDADKDGAEPDADDPYAHVSLRQVERKVRLHLMQIKAEDLCATRAHRQFLDQLLKMAQLERTQTELEAQLQATEHLADWIDANTRESSEKNRNVLLAFLTLLGIFGLSGFLAELDKGPGQKFLGIIPMRAPGVWEDNLVFVAFVAAFLGALYFDLLFWDFGMHRWMKKQYKKCLQKVRQAFAKARKNKMDNPTNGGSAR